MGKNYLQVFFQTRIIKVFVMNILAITWDVNPKLFLLGNWGYVIIPCFHYCFFHRIYVV